MSSARLHGLDALRGIAALVVVLFCHETYLIGAQGHRPILNASVYNLVTAPAPLAVDVFFVISGFVFTHVYFATGQFKTTARRFARSRFARLYPLHIATLLATAWLLSYGTPLVTPIVQPDAWHFVLNVLLLQGSGLEQGWNYNSPSWSISVEAICYAVFLLATRVRRYDALAIALVAIGLVACALDINVNVGRGLAGFFAGSLAYRYRFPNRWVIALLALSLPMLALPKPIIFPAFSITGGVAIVLIASKWNPSRPLIWLGDRSYSIYLIHVPMFWAVSMFILDSRFITEPLAYAVVALTLAAVLIIADASYRYFETPLRTWINRWPSTSEQRKSLAG